MISSGREYHLHTGYERRKLSGHLLDWANQPDIYKEYPRTEKVMLSLDVPMPNETFFQIIGKADTDIRPESISLEEISRIFALAYSITLKSRYPGGEFFHRSVPSAGGLYPCELYMANRNASESSEQNLQPGLYHYAVSKHALERLRPGNFLEKGCALRFFVTAVFFRSAWKYRERSYRYHLLDAGHLVENLVLTLKSLGLPFRANDDFEDREANHFLGLDPQKEVCLAIIDVPGMESASETSRLSEIETLPEAFREASRTSQKEIHYPALTEIHEKTSRLTASANPLPDMLTNICPRPISWQNIPKPETFPEKMNYAEAAIMRRSLRNFVRKSLPKAYYQSLIKILCEGGADDVGDKNAVCIGFLTENIEGVEPGYYLLNRRDASAALVKSGFFMEKMAHICLDQEWLAQAALHFFFVTNLQILEKHQGARGYRHAMLRAGGSGQRIYLGATAMGLGCCGIGAFYDKEAAEFLELNEPSAMLYLLAVGQVKKFF